MPDESSPLLSQKDPEGGIEESTSTETGRTQKDTLFLSVAVLGIFLAMVDESFVLSTHDRIASDFHQSSLGPWLLSGYSIGYFVSLPAYGRISHLYGHKKPLLAAYLTFAVGCTIIGTAPSIWAAVAGRIVAGAGAAGMVDLVTIAFNNMLPQNEVAVYRGYITFCCVIGFCSGGPLGGILIELIGWRWSFLGQVPIGLLCFFIALRRLPSSVNTESHKSSEGEESFGSWLKKLDVTGLFFLAVIMIDLMLLYRAFGEQSWKDSNMTSVLLSLLILFAIMFVINESWASEPLVPFWLLKHNGLGVVFLVQTLLTVSTYATMFKLTEYFIRTEKVSERVASVTLLPILLGSAFGSVLMGQLLKRTQRYKAVLLINLIIGMTCFSVMAIRWRCPVSPWELTYVFIGYVAMTGGFSAQFMALSASTPKEHSATVFTIYYLCQQMGINLAIFVTASISRWVFENDMRQSLGTDQAALKIIHDVLNRTQVTHSLPEHIRQILATSFLKSFQTVPLLSLCTAALAFGLVVAQR